MISQKYNLINFGFNPWSHFWKRNQTITYMLGELDLFDQVLFVNSEVWLGNLLRDFNQQMSQPHINNWKAVLPRKVSKKIIAYTPVYFPFKDRFALIDKLTSCLNNKVVRRYIKKPFVLILNNPQITTKKLDFLLHKSILTIFDWSDDFVEFSSNQNERVICSNTCKHYCQQSDIVLTVNEKLRDKALSYNEHAFTIRNATNFFTFQKPSYSTEKYSKIKRSGKPVIGYIGWLNSLRLDLDLIHYIVQERPKWQFVFMGPKSEDFPLGNKISKMSNVHILPPVSYSEYPSYLTDLDVCILPNKISPHTEGNDPIKIYDYLASGNPTVTTKTAGTKRFSEYLMIASNKGQFLEYLDLAVKENSVELKKKRRNIARKHSWQERMKEICQIIEPLLDMA